MSSQLSMTNLQPGGVYWQTLKSNIMLPETQTLDLGLHTLLVGETGEGKSRILRSLALALTGSAEDVGGKSGAVKDGNTLSEMVHPSQAGFVSELLLSTGKVASYTLKVSTKGAVSKKHLPLDSEVHEWALPVRKIQTMLSGRTDLVRARFLPYILGDLDTSAVRSRLPDDIIAEAEGYGVTIPEDVDGLAEAITKARERKTKTSREIAANTHLVETLTEDLEPDPTEEDLATIDALLEAARAWEEAPDYGALVEEKDGLEKRLKKAGKRLKKLPKPPKMPAEPEYEGMITTPRKYVDKRSMLETAIVALELSIDNDRSSCLCCGTKQSEDDFDKRLAKAKKGLGKLESKMARELRREQKRIEKENQKLREAYEEKVKQRELALQLISDAKSSVQSQRDRYDAIVALLGDRVPTCAVTVADTEEARLRLYRTQSAHVMIRDARDQIHKAGKAEAFWRTYHKLLGQVSKEIMKEVQDGFVDACQANMPKGWSFGLSLMDNGKEVFEPTLSREDRDSCKSPSGGERFILHCCMAAACISGLENPPPAPIFMQAEERGLYGKSLAEFCKATKNFPYQIVIYTMARPKGMPRSGWTTHLL